MEHPDYDMSITFAVLDDGILNEGIEILKGCKNLIIICPREM